MKNDEKRAMKRSRTSEKTKRKAVKAIKLHDYNIAMEMHKYIKKRTLKGALKEIRNYAKKT